MDQLCKAPLVLSAAAESKSDSTPPRGVLWVPAIQCRWLSRAVSDHFVGLISRMDFLGRQRL